MIDITPYQERLEWLKEWMAIRINAWFLRSVIDCFKETGHIIYYHENELSGFTFEMYCDMKERNK